MDTDNRCNESTNVEENNVEFFEDEPIYLNVNKVNTKAESGKRLLKIAIKSISVIGIVICLFVLFSAASKTMRMEKFMKTAVEAKGYVSKTEIYDSVGSRSYYRNYVTYTIKGVTYENVYWGETTEYIAGKYVKIYYNPEHPEEISDGYIFSLKTRNLMIVMIAVVGGLVSTLVPHRKNVL